MEQDTPGFADFYASAKDYCFSGPAADAGPAANAGRVDHDVLAAVGRLPDRQRQVVALRFLLDLDVAQTARALGLAEGTVRAHTARAVAAIREGLSPAAEEERA